MQVIFKAHDSEFDNYFSDSVLTTEILYFVEM